MHYIATKSNLKGAAGIDTSNFAKKADLNSLKSNIDKLDVNNSETTPVDLSILSDLVKSEVAKTTVYDELIKKVRNWR